MKKIGLFYAPKGGSTEKAAQQVAETIGQELVDVYFVNDISLEDILKYDNIILGTATVDNDAWDGKHPRNNWDIIFPKFRDVDLTGKTAALFALGNQVLYPRHFVDPLGQFGHVLQERGARIVGQVPGDNYNFEESEGLQDGKFIGLPLDNDTEEDMTPERIQNWVAQIKPEFKL